MQVDYAKVDDLNARMTVRVSRDDYEAKYKSALLDYRKKASLKGFRKGKTPFGYLEKLFGHEVLTKTVTDLLTDSVNEYLETHQVPYIGQPLPASDQTPISFDPKALQDEYVYSFDIGLLPDFEVQGLDQEIEWMDLPVSDEEVEKEWQELLKRQGTYEEVETVDAESRVNVHLREMDGDTPKEGGREHTRRIYISMLQDDVRDAFVGKQVGDTVTFDPNAFLKQGDVQLFKRYYFDIKDESETISDKVSAEILEITTLKPAEPNEEFYNQAFEAGKVTTEEEAREVIRGALKQRNDSQSDAHLRHMIEHRLMDANKFDLPHAFLDRLVGASEEAQQNEDGEEKDEKAAEKQADGFRWHFIKDKLAKKFAIEVSQDDIMRAAADHVYDRFGGYLPYDRMREIITQYISNQDTVAQLRSSVVDMKLFQALKESMPVVKKETTKEKFDAELAEHQHAHHHE